MRWTSDGRLGCNLSDAIALVCIHFALSQGWEWCELSLFVCGCSWVEIRDNARIYVFKEVVFDVKVISGMSLFFAFLDLGILYLAIGKSSNQTTHAIQSLPLGLAIDFLLSYDFL
jgi:hypothetical protein